MIVKHRDIDYDVEEAAPGKWRWKIYPKIEAGPKVIGETLFESRDAAIAACIAEINSGLDRKTDATRPSAMGHLQAIAVLVAMSSSVMAGDDAKTAQSNPTRDACVSAAATAYLTANAALVSRATSTGLMSIEDVIAQRRLQESYCKQFAGCIAVNISPNPSLSDMTNRAMFASCLDDEAKEK
jgi:hypothetical protein